MAILRGTPDSDFIVSGSNADTLLGFAGNDSLFGNGGADQLRGGTGNDELLGAARTTDPDDGGKDNLSGGAGGDRLLGGLGADLLIGGTDADQFLFEQRGPFEDPVYDTGVGKGNRDRITDFAAAEGDLINLLFVDDDVTDDVQGVFSFVGEIGSGGLDKGELGYIETGGNTILRANTDDGAAADFEIQLDGVGLDLTATDFVL